MVNVYEYADSNDQTEYFLRGRSKTSGQYKFERGRSGAIGLERLLPALRGFDLLKFVPAGSQRL